MDFQTFFTIVLASGYGLAFSFYFYAMTQAVIDARVAKSSVYFALVFGIVLCAWFGGTNEMLRVWRFSICAVVGAGIAVSGAWAIDRIWDVEGSLAKTKLLAEAAERTKNEGVLTPANLPDPDLSKIPVKVPDDSFLVEYGSNLAVGLGSDMPTDVMTMNGEPIISVRREGGTGNLQLTTLRLFDTDYKIIARVDADGFWVRSDIRKKRPDDHTLIVFNSRDEEVLHLTFTNRRTLTISGVFRYPGAETVVMTASEMRVGNAILKNSSSGYYKTAVAIGKPQNMQKR